MQVMPLRVTTRPAARSLLRGLALAVVALGLAACGAFRLTYDNGDTVATIWLNHYLDMTHDEEALASLRIDRFIQWHRSTELADYTNLANAIRARVGGEVTREDVIWLEDALRVRWYRLLDRALPDVADFALSLKREQLQALAKRFESNNEDFRDERITPRLERRQTDHYEKTLDRAEFWYGHFDRSQRQVLRAACDAQPIDDKLWLEERIARQKALLALLDRIITEHPSRDAVVGLLGPYLKSLETSADPKRRAYIEALHESNVRLAALVASLATEDQKRHAQAKLADLANDFQTLARETGS